MTMTPREIAQTETTTEAFAAIYTDPEMMACWLAQPETTRDKLVRARHCYQVARDPRGRFGLDGTPEDVRRVLESFFVALEPVISRAHSELVELRSQGLSWDECWNLFETGHGFGPGDSRLLGF